MMTTIVSHLMGVAFVVFCSLQATPAHGTALGIYHLPVDTLLFTAAWLHLLDTWYHQHL